MSTIKRRLFFGVIRSICDVAEEETGEFRTWAPVGNFCKGDKVTPPFHLSFPLSSPSFFPLFPSSPSSSPSLFPYPLPILPSAVRPETVSLNPAKERCKLPERGPGRVPSANAISVYFEPVKRVVIEANLACTFSRGGQPLDPVIKFQKNGADFATFGLFCRSVTYIRPGKSCFSSFLILVSFRCSFLA